MERRRTDCLVFCIDTMTVLPGDIRAFGAPYDDRISSGHVTSSLKVGSTQMITDYDVFVKELKATLIDYYGLELICSNNSNDSSKNHSFIARNKAGEIMARFQLRLRISDLTPMHSKVSQRLELKEERSSEFFGFCKERAAGKAKPFGQAIMVNGKWFDSYQDALFYIDDVLSFSLEPPFASSFYNGFSQSGYMPLCFISAYKETRSNVQNEMRNDDLELDIEKANLSFVRSTGKMVKGDGSNQQHVVWGDMFCVIDDRYPPEDFKKLALSWCKKYDQDAILLRMPRLNLDKLDPTERKLLHSVAQCYDGSGNAVGSPLEDLSVANVEKFIINTYGKPLCLVSTEVSI